MPTRGAVPRSLTRRAPPGGVASTSVARAGVCSRARSRPPTEESAGPSAGACACRAARIRARTSAVHREAGGTRGRSARRAARGHAPSPARGRPASASSTGATLGTGPLGRATCAQLQSGACPGRLAWRATRAVALGARRRRPSGAAIVVDVRRAAALVLHGGVARTAALRAARLSRPAWRAPRPRTGVGPGTPCGRRRLQLPGTASASRRSGASAGQPDIGATPAQRRWRSPHSGHAVPVRVGGVVASIQWPTDQLRWTACDVVVEHACACGVPA